MPPFLVKIINISLLNSIWKLVESKLNWPITLYYVHQIIVNSISDDKQDSSFRKILHSHKSN